MPLILGTNGPEFVPASALSLGGRRPQAVEGEEASMTDRLPDAPGLEPAACGGAPAFARGMQGLRSGSLACRVPGQVKRGPGPCEAAQAHAWFNPNDSNYVEAYEAEPDAAAHRAEVVCIDWAVQDAAGLAPEPHAAADGGASHGLDCVVATAPGCSTRYDGTAKWWEVRAFEPALAQILLQCGVEPDDVQPWAPTTLTELLTCARPQPYGCHTATLRDKAATMLICSSKLKPVRVAERLCRHTAKAEVEAVQEAIAEAPRARHCSKDAFAMIPAPAATSGGSRDTGRRSGKQPMATLPSERVACFKLGVTCCAGPSANWWRNPCVRTEGVVQARGHLLRGPLSKWMAHPCLHTAYESMVL